jgi:hypothetical protein
LPTLDDVVGAMRERFTPSQAGQVVTEARITAAEWNALASLLYIRDAAKEVADTPTDTSAVERLKDEVLLAQSDGAGVRSKR